MTFNNSNTEELAARFNKVYANLPLGMREEIALILEDRPVSWNVAYIEIKNETDLAEKILVELSEMKLI